MDYGYIVIFLMLVLGIVGLLILDEVMMIVVGYFMYIDVLNYEFLILISFVGVLLGMLISYMIGRKVGCLFIDKYGKWVGLKEKRMMKVEKWMNKYGLYFFIFGYFIFGVRYMMCYFLGIGKMNLKIYIVFVVIGVFLWCFIFIIIGRVIGIIYV